MLHSKLAELLGGGLTAYDAYNSYKDYANEKQLINIVMMALMSDPHFIVLNPVCILSLIPGKILRFNVLHNPIVNNLPRLK